MRKIRSKGEHAQKPASTAQLKKLIEARLVELEQNRISFADHKGHPQLLELFHKTKGQIDSLEDIRDMFRYKLPKPICW